MQVRTISGINSCVWEPADTSRRYPVILLTHGAGCRGTDISVLKTHPVVTAVLAATEEVILVAPQCNSNTWFDVFGNLIDLAKTVAALPNADPRRFYGIGVSMGGYAMVQLMESRPELFTAGMILCGGGMYWNADRLRNISLRLIHGEQDTTVYPEESRRLYDRLVACGGDAELRLYPDCGHNCWDRALSETENLDWLLKKEKTK